MENNRKQQIIKAAVKRFARHGLNKTTLDEIARDLRIGKATIYHYFTSKEELFYQTLHYDASLFIDDIKNILNNEQLELKERLAEYFVFKLDVYNKYKLLYDLFLRILKEEKSDKDEESLKEFLQNEEEIVKQIFISFNIRSAEGDLPKFIVQQSWGLLLGKKLDDIKGGNISQNFNELILQSLGGIIKH